MKRVMHFFIVVLSVAWHFALNGQTFCWKVSDGDTIWVVLMMKNPTAYTHLLTWSVPIGSLIDEIFGDLSECEDLRSQNSPVEIIYYIYGLAMHYDTESAQHSEIQVLLDAIEKGKAFDRNSMLIPSCLRCHKDLNINEFFARVKKACTQDITTLGVL